MFVKKELTLKVSEKSEKKIGDRIDLGFLIDSVNGVVDELAGAIFEEATEIKNKSQDIVPKDFGTLEASADAVGVNAVRNGSRGAVVIGYGGEASAYSFIQHQTPPPDEAGEGELAFTHLPGRMWKYLERPSLEAAEGMEARIAARIRKRLAAR